jgi:hypothetical protein
MRARLELLEDRALLAVTSITVNPINPTEGVPFGSAVAQAQIGKFVVNNYIGIDESSLYSASVKWGDGTESAGLGPVTVTFLADQGNGTASYSVNSYHTYADATTTPNPYSLTITVADNTGPGTLQSQSGPVAVNDQPLTSTLPATTTNATVGVALTNVTVGRFIDSNPLATADDYAVQVAWGDGTTSAGTIVPYRTAAQLGGTGVEFTVEASHTYTTTGNFSVLTTVNDFAGSSTTSTSSVVVSSSSLQQITAAPINAVEGLPFTGNVASFTDPNPGNTAASFTATIDWGNGDVTAGTVVGTGPSYTVTAVDPVSHHGYAYPEEGIYNVTVSVAGPAGANFTAFTTANVADAPLTASGLTLGVAPLIFQSPAFSGPVATFTDADPNGTLTDYTATINWGDGVTSPGTITLSPTIPGQFVVSGTHSFAQSASPYQVLVTIKDEGGSTATAFTSIIISDTPLTPGTPLNINAIEGQSVTAAVATFTDANPAAVPSQYAVTIGWGDGTTSGGVIAKQADGTFIVSGTHTYLEESPAGTPFVTSVTVANIGGSNPTSTTIPGTATVADAPIASIGSPINGTEGLGLNPATLTIATFTDADPYGTVADYTAMINWGDGTAPSLGTITQTGISPNGSTFSVTASHVYAEEGSYQTQVTITDVGGSKSVAVGNAVIADAPLNAGSPQPSVNVTEMVPFTGPVAIFTDANPLAPLGDFSAIIHWGDGTPDTAGTVSQPGGVGSAFIVTGSHTYATSGTNGGIGHFPITVSIRDVGGSTLTVANTANVADTPLIVQGFLDPASDSGVSNSDGITNVVQPTFLGRTSEPFATVTVYAQPSGGGMPMPIGQGSSDGAGDWSITSTRALADGSYTITAIATDQAGHTVSNTATLAPNLVIDTVGPKVTNLYFNRFVNQIQYGIQDFGGSGNAGAGLNQGTVADASNYLLTKLNVRRPGSYKVNVISVVPGSTSGEQVATLTINQGATLRGGQYYFTIRSMSPNVLTGVQDIAGNALDGEFYGNFPSGNNHVGGDFVAKLDSKHHMIFPPQSVIGDASPSVPLVPPANGRPNLRAVRRLKVTTTPRAVVHRPVNHHHTLAPKRLHHGH